MAYANSGSSGRGKNFQPMETKAGREQVNMPTPREENSPQVRNLPRRKMPARTLFALKVVVIVLLGQLAWSSCRQRPSAQSSQPLVFALESEPERLDPLTIKSPKTFPVAWQIYEGLLDLSPDGKIEPRLAEAWETEDFQTWRFTLRQAYFHSSKLFGTSGTRRQVTADDVVWSYTAYCAPGAYASFLLSDTLKGCAKHNAGEAETVEGIRAIDLHTVEMSLIEPDPFFLNRITTAWPAVVPREGYEPAVADKWGFELAVGTGPYRLVSRSDTEVVLARNPDYWSSDRIPQIDKIVFRVIKNEAVRMAELRKGGLDIVSVPPALYPSVLDPEGHLRPAYSKGYSVKTYPTFNHHLIGFNIEMVPDVHLRRAMSFGTDREAIVRELLSGFADVINGPVPSVMPGSVEVAGSLFSHERAREEMALSHYQGETLELLVHDLASSERVGEIFQQQMKEIGIQVELTKLDYGSVVQRAIRGEVPLFSLFAEIVFSSPEPLLINLFSSTKIPVPNFWKYSDPWMDEQLASLRRVGALEERLAKSVELQRKIIDDAPAIFLYSEQHLLLQSRRTRNLQVNPHEHFRLEEARIIE